MTKSPQNSFFIQMKLLILLKISNISNFIFLLFPRKVIIVPRKKYSYLCSVKIIKGKNMNITEISSNSQIQLVLNKADLKELFLEWKEESELNRKKETETLLTPDEVASKYRISKVTLWRWAKDGLLKPVKMGRKSFYRQSDIERVFDLDK